MGGRQRQHTSLETLYDELKVAAEKFPDIKERIVEKKGVVLKCDAFFCVIQKSVCCKITGVLLTASYTDERGCAFDARGFGTNSRNTVQKKIKGPCVQTLSLLAPQR